MHEHMDVSTQIYKEKKYDQLLFYSIYSKYMSSSVKGPSPAKTFSANGSLPHLL